MIRTAWFLLWLVLSTIYYGTVATVSGILRVRNRPGGPYDYCARGWGRTMLWAAGIDVTVKGLERMPVDEPVVFVSNHQSWFDIFLLLGHLPDQVRYVAKKELRRVPFLGTAMAAGQHIFIDRNNRQAAFSAYEDAARNIRAGRSAVVFAEGTRSRTGELLPFKKGPFVLAIAAQAPVMPLYCAGTFTLLPSGSLWITPHPVTLWVGDPLPTKGLDYNDRDRIMQETRSVIEALRDGANGREFDDPTVVRLPL